MGKKAANFVLLICILRNLQNFCYLFLRITSALTRFLRAPEKVFFVVAAGSFLHAALVV